MERMMELRKGLRRLAGVGRLLMEVRGLRKEVADLRVGIDRIAAALETYNAHQWPQRTPPTQEAPSIEVSYADDVEQQTWMDIELRLTAARGMPPTEDEIYDEFMRLRAQAAEQEQR